MQVWTALTYNEICPQNGQTQKQDFWRVFVHYVDTRHHMVDITKFFRFFKICFYAEVNADANNRLKWIFAFWREIVSFFVMIMTKNSINLFF